MRESHRILQESVGNRWNMEAIFRQEPGGKHWKNFRPDCLTWVASIASSAYSIDYIFKNMPIEMGMKKRTDKIFITFKVRKIYLHNME